jgi:hypothetical protein
MKYTESPQFPNEFNTKMEIGFMENYKEFYGSPSRLNSFENSVVAFLQINVPVD